MLIDAGDPALGEWIDSSRTALHVRRRLNEHEQLRVIVRDIRRTAEAERRWLVMPRQCRELVPAFVVDEEVGPLMPKAADA